MTIHHATGEPTCSLCLAVVQRWTSTSASWYERRACHVIMLIKQINQPITNISSNHPLHHDNIPPTPTQHNTHLEPLLQRRLGRDHRAVPVHHHVLKEQLGLLHALPRQHRELIDGVPRAAQRLTEAGHLYRRGTGVWSCHSHGRTGKHTRVNSNSNSASQATYLVLPQQRRGEPELEEGVGPLALAPHERRGLPVHLFLCFIVRVGEGKRREWIGSHVGGVLCSVVETQIGRDAGTVNVHTAAKLDSRTAM